MTLLETLESLGVFAIGGALLAFVFRSIYKHLLNKDIEEFKHKLKQEQIRGSKLYDERAKVVSMLYELLADFDFKMSSFVSPAQFAGDLPKKEKLKLAGEAGREFMDYHTKKRIYFDKDINKSLDEINKEFKSAWVDATLFPITEPGEWEFPNVTKEKWEFWKKSLDTICKKIPPLKEKLEDDFREILGVS